MTADTRPSTGARTPTESRRERRSAEARADQFRPEIQGLRAVAVGLVVLFHLWPTRLTGGYVGVDVFFVISGYLITAHIVREVDQTGTVRLRRFWARRVRRLLPASLLVLALSAVAVIAFVPATLWAQSARQIAASALYVQNWALALDSVDYMAADNVPTVAQHYWSLSVEEQFYLVWPVLVLALVALARRGRPGRAGRRGRVHGVLVAGIGLAAAASLTWSVVSTAQDQAFAYMSTFTRVWEFAAGALTALLVPRSLSGGRAGWVLGWTGLAAVVVAGVTFHEGSLFPGWIALLPVLGTVALIVAGRGGALSAGHWLSRRPARFVGDISYSVYLWHWPLIVVVPFATGRDLTRLDKLAVLAATILLAWLSKTYVEDPLRVRPLLAAAPWRAFAFAGLGMATMVAVGTGISAELDRREVAAVARAAAETENAARCAGPGALDPARDCGPVVGRGQLLVPPEVVVQQNTDPPFRGCQQSLAPSDVRRCELGDTSDPERVVALVGDSHATHWFTAFDQLGRERGWKIVTMTKTSCPVTEALRVLPSEQTDAEQASCREWVDGVRSALLADEQVGHVYVSAYSTAYEWDSRPGERLADPGPDGFAAFWSDLTAAGKQVVVLAAVPRTTGENVPNCLVQNAGDPLACAVPRSEALPGDVMLEAAAGLDDPAVRVADLSEQFCDERLCYPVVGDVIVYRDYSHLSAEYSRMLLPYLEELGAFS